MNNRLDLNYRYDDKTYYLRNGNKVKTVDGFERCIINKIDKFESPPDSNLSKKFENLKFDSISSRTRLMTTIDSKNSMASQIKNRTETQEINYFNNLFQKSVIDSNEMHSNSKKLTFVSMIDKEFLKLSNKLTTKDIEKTNCHSDRQKRVVKNLEHLHVISGFKNNKNMDPYQKEILNKKYICSSFDDDKEYDLNFKNTISNFIPTAKTIPRMLQSNKPKKQTVIMNRDKFSKITKLNKNNFLNLNFKNLAKHHRRGDSLACVIENKQFIRKIPVITSIPVLNKFLISDFSIGESRNKAENSKFKMNLTDKIFEDFGEKKKRKMLREQEEFEVMKYGVTLNKLTQDNRKKNDLVDSRKIDINTCRSELANLKEQNKKRIEERSKKLTELIRDISTSYEESGDEAVMDRNNMNNINRLIRVRNIIKNKRDNKSDGLLISNLKNCREEKLKMDIEFIKRKDNFAPPSFMKTKFKMETERKYKVVTGKYFGVNL